jgi:hypothetical protein
MRRFFGLIALSVSLSIVAAPDRAASAATDCGEPVPAPKWEIGDTWTFQDETGGENQQRVTGFEGGLIRLEVTRVGGRPVVQFWDPEYVLRRVIEPGGKVVDRPGEKTWTWLGQKVLEFPLASGKAWLVSHEYEHQTFSDTYRVVGCEEVAIIAGKLPALKMEVTRRRVGGGQWRGVFHEWYAPRAKRAVRRVYQRPGFPERLRDWELLRYRVK